jgi:hypothetical protein
MFQSAKGHNAKGASLQGFDNISVAQLFGIFGVHMLTALGGRRACADGSVCVFRLGRFAERGELWVEQLRG